MHYVITSCDGLIKSLWFEQISFSKLDLGEVLFSKSFSQRSKFSLIVFVSNSASDLESTVFEEIIADLGAKET